MRCNERCNKAVTNPVTKVSHKDRHFLVLQPKSMVSPIAASIKTVTDVQCGRFAACVPGAGAQEVAGGRWAPLGQTGGGEGRPAWFDGVVEHVAVGEVFDEEAVRVAPVGAEHQSHAP